MQVMVELFAVRLLLIGGMLRINRKLRLNTATLSALPYKMKN
jgi:hypothetical protein